MALGWTETGLPGYRSEHLSASEAWLGITIGLFEEPLSERWYPGRPVSCGVMAGSSFLEHAQADALAPDDVRGVDGGDGFLDGA
jgi:hypothetical protein